MAPLRLPAVSDAPHDGRARRPRPDQPVLLVVAERLVVGAGGEGGGDRRHVARRVVAPLALEEHGAGAGVGDAQAGEPRYRRRSWR